jgi:hypothetical protein
MKKNRFSIQHMLVLTLFTSIWCVTLMEVRSSNRSGNLAVEAALALSSWFFVGALPGYAVAYFLYGRKEAWKGAVLTWLFHFVFFVYLPALNAVRE